MLQDFVLYIILSIKIIFRILKRFKTIFKLMDKPEAIHYVGYAPE